MIWLLYNLLFPVAFLLMLPTFISRMVRRGGYKKHFEQRFGIFGDGVMRQLNDVQRIWIHAVSVGEIHVALRFIEAYRAEHSDARFVLSTTTSTAHALACDKLDERDVLIYFPLDFPLVMTRVFNAINPRRIVLVECEFWPNMIREAHRRNIPVALINGRVSDSSYKGYMKLRVWMRQILGRVHPLCVQGQQDAERMVAMGARPDTVKTLGTAKYDLPPPAADAAASATSILSQAGVSEDAVILLGGSTWPGEEEALCKIYQTLRQHYPALFLVLVPRHAERRDEVVGAVAGQGLSYALRSQLNAEPAVRPDVLIVDTTGELMSFYAASDLVFVGKSLCEHGGQNPIEPALFGKPIVVGPNMENFPSVMADFLSDGALEQVDDLPALEKALGDLMADPARREELGAAAARLVDARRGVVSKMVKAVEAA